MRKHSRGQSGVGLIEVMIALLLGIIIMLGVTEIATNNSKTRYELQRTGQQIENAAYAMRLLEGDLTNAAYWGERGAVSPGGTLPPVCPDTAAELEDAMGYPLQGGSGNVDCPDSGNELQPKAGTDYIAIRRVSSCQTDTAGCGDHDGNFQVQVRACFDASDPIKPGDFQLTDNAGAVGAGTNYTQRNCSDASPYYRFLNRVYFVNADDQLVRSELVGNAYTAPEVLVEDVELLRFGFGIVDAAGQIDASQAASSDDQWPFVSDPNEPQWPDAGSVRITMVVRNDQPSGGFLDDKVYNVAGSTYCVDGALSGGGNCDISIPAAVQSHRRQLYTRTVSIRNIAGRRE